MSEVIVKIAQAVLPFAIQKFANKNKDQQQIKQLEIEVKKLRKRAILLLCLGFMIGVIIGFLIAYFFF